MLVTAAGLVGTAALAAGGLHVARRRWEREGECLRSRLRSAAAAVPAAPIEARDFDLVPAPVAGFLRQVVPEGSLPPASVRVRWQGEFNLGRPGETRWAPFTAEQCFVPAAPGFVWDARIRMGPGVEVFVRDGLVGGVGSMRARLAAAFTVARAEGTAEIARGALLRYLGEAAWFPAALLPRMGVSWEAIDGRRARAHAGAGAAAVALEFRFGDDGRLASVFAPDRPCDDGRGRACPRPWQARLLAWGDVGGRTVPTDAVVEWWLDSGPWPYWRGRPLAIEVAPAAA
jgi:hypothetical protein